MLSCGKKTVRIFAVIGLAAALLAIIFAQMAAPARASMNITISPETNEVKIHTGTSQVSAPLAYRNARAALLAQLANEQPAREFAAVVPMDDYYTIEEVNSFISSHSTVSIERIYMWTPGETGKLVLDSTSNDIQDDVDRYLEVMASRPATARSEALQRDLQKLEDGEFMVYALTVTASAEVLNSLSANADMVSFVDLKYNPEAEAYASQNDMIFSYHELPEKPDGAL